MLRLLASLRSAAPLFWRAAFSLLGGLLLVPLSVQAATYTFKSDSYAWETAANAITWDRTCTGYPGDDDKATITLTGGFTFTFAGTAYNSVRVLTNGMLQFGADTGFFRNYTNTNLPAGNATAQSGCTAAATTQVLMAYWTDLDPSRAGSGNVTWEQKGSAPNRRLVVSWNSVYQYNTSTPYAFQVILYENGEFKYQYGNANATGSNATIGVQVSATDYTLYSYNSGYNANGSAIRWFIPSGTPTRLAEYRMDEYSYNGTIGEVTDTTGNGYGGVRVGSAASSAGGYVCRAVDIPANTTAALISAVDTSIDIDSALGADGAVSFWYRSNAAWNTAPEAQLFDASGSATRPFFLTRKSDGRLRFILSDSAGTLLDAASSARTTAAGTWTHVAVTWRLAAGAGQSNLRIYVNGSQVGAVTGTTNGQLDTSLLTLFLGDNRTAATPANASAASANGQLDEVKVYNYEISALEILADMAVTHGCPPPLHHVEIRHAGGGSGLTCTPSTLTVLACQDAACATQYTGGLAGSMTATGTPSVVWPGGAAFSIPNGSGSITKDVQVTTPGTVDFGVTGLSVTPTNATSCNFGSPACRFTAVDAGLQFDVPNHVADAVQTVSVRAVRKSDNGLACTPAFASVSKAITFSCGHSNPASGTLPVRMASGSNNASVACGGAGQSLTLAFDSTGTASASVQYADVGQLSLTGRYTGSGNDAGLVMTGTDSFIAAPANFAFSNLPAGNVVADSAFTATVTARNSSNAATPNFGRETTPATPTIGFARRQPTGAGASDGAFAPGTVGGFSAGAATIGNMKWSEVGRIDLTATLANYLASGLSASGNTGTGTGAIGEFIPHRFDIERTAHGCPAGNFTYAGQPFGVRIRAENASGNTTANYNGTSATTPVFANATTITTSNQAGLGSFGSTGDVPASAFNGGIATLTTPAFTYTTKQTYNTSDPNLMLRATEAAGGNGVTSAVAGADEQSTPLRSGRLLVANGYGSEKSALKLAVRAEYWSGAAWVLNAADGCTSVAAAAVALSNYRDQKGNSGAWTTTPSAFTLAGGLADLTLSAPSGGATGSVDLALNLGSTTTDASCNAAHPATTGATVPWLRSRNGNCAGWAADPSARASFGVYSPESKKTIHVREIF